MSFKSKLVVGLLIIVCAIALLLPWFDALYLRSNLKRDLAQVNIMAQQSGYQLEMTRYQKGWFRSNLWLNIRMGKVIVAKAELQLTHGPILFYKGGIHIGALSYHSTVFNIFPIMQPIHLVANGWMGYQGVRMQGEIQSLKAVNLHFGPQSMKLGHVAVNYSLDRAAETASMQLDLKKLLLKALPGQVIKMDDLTTTGVLNVKAKRPYKMSVAVQGLHILDKNPTMSLQAKKIWVDNLYYNPKAVTPLMDMFNGQQTPAAMMQSGLMAATQDSLFDFMSLKTAIGWKGLVVNVDDPAAKTVLHSDLDWHFRPGKFDDNLSQVANFTRHMELRFHMDQPVVKVSVPGLAQVSLAKFVIDAHSGLNKQQQQVSSVHVKLPMFSANVLGSHASLSNFAISSDALVSDTRLLHENVVVSLQKFCQSAPDASPYCLKDLKAKAVLKNLSLLTKQLAQAVKKDPQRFPVPKGASLTVAPLSFTDNFGRTNIHVTAKVTKVTPFDQLALGKNVDYRANMQLPVTYYKTWLEKLLMQPVAVSFPGRPALTGFKDRLFPGAWPWAQTWFPVVQGDYPHVTIDVQQWGGRSLLQQKPMTQLQKGQLALLFGEYKQASQLFQSIATQPKAALYAGLLAMQAKKPKQAQQLWRAAAKKGDAKAQALLSYDLLTTAGTHQACDEGLAWAKQQSPMILLQHYDHRYVSKGQLQQLSSQCPLNYTAAINVIQQLQREHNSPLLMQRLVDDYLGRGQAGDQLHAALALVGMYPSKFVPLYKTKVYRMKGDILRKIGTVLQQSNWSQPMLRTVGTRMLERSGLVSAKKTDYVPSYLAGYGYVYYSLSLYPALQADAQRDLWRQHLMQQKLLKGAVNYVADKRYLPGISVKQRYWFLKTEPSKFNQQALAHLKREVPKATWDSMVKIFDAREKAILHHDAAAQEKLGAMYLYNSGQEQDLAKAKHWLEKAAKQGNANAYYDLGYYYDEHESDYQQALSWYQKAADKGITNAYADMSNIYYFGRGVPQNLKKAVALAKQGAEKGNAFCQSHLAVYYLMGQGVTKNTKQGLYWLQKAVDAGNPQATRNLANIYQNGQYGVERNMPKAIALYKEAANAGNGSAGLKLGVIYYMGDQVPKDKVRAVYWWKKAVAAGNNAALENLCRIQQAGKYSHDCAQFGN